MTASGRFDLCAPPPANDRYFRILLKNSETEPLRKSRIRAPRVTSADTPYGKAYVRVAGGKTGRSAEAPKEFYIKAASGLLNCD
jgi:hypothetical protein